MSDYSEPRTMSQREQQERYASITCARIHECVGQGRQREAMQLLVDFQSPKLLAMTEERDKLKLLVGEEWSGDAADKLLTNVEELTADRDRLAREVEELRAELSLTKRTAMDYPL